MQQQPTASRTEMAARITQLEADRDRMAGLLERVLAAQERTAAALDRLAPTPAITQTPPRIPLRLVR